MSESFDCIYLLEAKALKDHPSILKDKTFTSKFTKSNLKNKNDEPLGRYANKDDFDDFVKNNPAMEEFLTSKAKPVLLCNTMGSFREDFTTLVDRTTYPGNKVEEIFKFYQPKAQPAEHSLNYQLDDSAEANLKLNLLSPSKKFSYESELWVCNSNQTAFAHGRAAACLCYRGEKWSITFRRKDEFKPKKLKIAPEPKCPNPKKDKKSKPSPKYLNEPEQIFDILYNVIFSDSKPKNGLVVIAGRTGSMKSQIANGFIKSYLKERAKDKSGRSPHLLTYEDPIEEEFGSEEIECSDYTPREKNKDTPNLNEVIDLALRQTPAILFVGETRDPKDWEALLRFAGTGHLVITTTHAGSLTEAMENIFQATKSHTPAARNVVADRLLAIIHLRPETIKLEFKKKETELKINNQPDKLSILLPALWHRTPNGVKALMAEGLSSLLPNNPNMPSKEEVEKEKKVNYPSSIGRFWFALKLLAESNHTVKTVSPPKFAEFKEKILQTATKWDLEGI